MPHLEQEKMDIISYDKICELTEPFGMDVTWRKLNYYKTLGLLPKAIRKQGDKRGYYPYPVFYDLIVFHFLQNDLGFTLEGIKKLVKDFKLPVDDKNQGLFSKWIQRTYGHFITHMRQKLERGEDLQRSGVVWTAKFNNIYKNALLGTGIGYLAKTTNKEKEIDDDLIAKKAEEWTVKAFADTLK